MLVIENVLVADEITEKQFVCNLEKCRGACCEEGDAGAPLDREELQLVNQYYEKIKPYLTDQAIKHIERNGKYAYHVEFGWVTPTLPQDREICAYGKRDENGVIQCAFERAWQDKVIDWKKPVSCHLFPAIIEKGKKGGYDRMNYEPRQVHCRAACTLGKKLKVPLHQFLQEAITRKYGKDFYEILDAAVKDKQEQKEKNFNAA